MSIVTHAKAAFLALSVVAATPVLAASPAETAGQRVQTLIKHDAALQADLLQVAVEGQTVYIRGVVDSSLEAREIDSLIGTVGDARIVNATIVTNFGS